MMRRPVIPDERCYASRDPWFDRLTTLSQVEGESRDTEQIERILDLPPPWAGDDKLWHSLSEEKPARRVMAVHAL